MQMYFYWGTELTILFQGWRTETAWEYALSCLFWLLAAVAYEWLSSFRRIFAERENAKNPSVNDDHTLEQSPLLSAGRSSTWSHLFITCIHVLQMTLAYAIMLVVMTYNLGLIIASLLGYGIGFFLFGRKRLEEPARCH